MTRLLPDGLRPQLVRGHAVAGICLLRLGDVRPSSRRPSFSGCRSAHTPELLVGHPRDNIRIYDAGDLPDLDCSPGRDSCAKSHQRCSPANSAD
ncbi:hypothetical protein ACTWQA_44875 [Nonomuraea sp. 10N515B]